MKKNPLGFANLLTSIGFTRRAEPLKPEQVVRERPSAKASVARLLSFAHLIGIGPKKGASAATAPAEPKVPTPRPKASQAPAQPARPADADDEMFGNDAGSAARNRERARCKAIYMSEAGQRNPELAGVLAFGTSLPRSEALAILDATPAPAPVDRLNLARAARNPRIGAGSSDAPSGHHVTAARWDAAFRSQGSKGRR